MAALVASLLIVLIGNAGATDGSRDSRWINARGVSTGTGGGQPVPVPLPSSGRSAASSGRPGAGPPRAWAAPAAPSTPPSPTGTPSASPSGLLARIPTFPPAPPAEKITLPPGPAAAWISRVPTSQKVAFITIDDGWTKQPDAIGLLQAAHVPVTLFLTTNAIRSDPGYFKQLEAAGAVIEAHTITHADLKGMSPSFQRHEICGSADQLGAIYGRRPVLFRPPFGDKDNTTLQVTHECGMKAAFFWKETVDKGVVRFQEGNAVQPGDILLMHFRPAFAEDFLAALQAIHDAGLTPALLEDYIP
ncbi:polysaccharide deacetylase family protein [Planosporangium mesophilum]|uniref:polysaccharide deacetylase family protein n=1 Tax=Planosporangium mesophilum TaxID=689768 RepID=UPI001EF1922F|nr:polysaccharide deacetylase family protein [Planosporangium mesophilum]